MTFSVSRDRHGPNRDSPRSYNCFSSRGQILSRHCPCASRLNSILSHSLFSLSLSLSSRICSVAIDAPEILRVSPVHLRTNFGYLETSRSCSWWLRTYLFDSGCISEDKGPSFLIPAIGNQDDHGILSLCGPLGEIRSNQIGSLIENGCHTRQ